MPRIKKASSHLAQIDFSESYISLMLGALVVLVAIFFVFFFSKSRIYDKINTAISTHQEETQILPSNSQVKTYEVKAGDNLWTIAENVYRSGYNWVDLAKANNLSNPGLINTGNKLIIPDVQKITVATVQSTQNNGPSISADSYKVVKGDYLWQLAIRAYGDGFKWTEIAKTNNILTPDLIYPDVILKLPR